MKCLIFIVLSIINGAVWGLTTEAVIPKVTVRLVRKNWRPSGYYPDTDDPLLSFPGTYSELYNLFKNYKTYEYVSQPLINATKLFDNPNYNASQPSLILTHPLTVGDSLFITQTIGALAMRNLQKHYNIFAMHAPWLSIYFQTTCARTAFGMRTMFEPMAEAFATYLLDGYTIGKILPEQISFIGFSYAATLNAYIARIIKEKTGRLTHTIFALDAFQHNYDNVYFTQMSASDAMFVHMVHSSSKLGGTTRRVATVDIVLNNGFLQPGCEGIFAAIGCSHRRSVVVFMFALVSAGTLMGRQCDSWDLFTECECNDANGKPILMVSFPVNQEARGVYYVRTTDKLPYTLGPQGAYCKADAEKPLPFPFNDEYA